MLPARCRRAVSSLAGAPGRLDTALPAGALIAALRRRGIAAAPSRSAGRYLCNFLYYLSLDWAARREGSPIVLFVHIPPGASQGGALSDADLLRGGETILRFALSPASKDDATSSIPRRCKPKSGAMTIGRRELMLGGLASASPQRPGPRAVAAREQPELPQPFSTYGIVPGGDIDQTASLQEAADKAARVRPPPSSCRPATTRPPSSR